MLRNDDFEDFTRKGISHSGIGLVNIWDSRMYQTGFQTCSEPARDHPAENQKSQISESSNRVPSAMIRIYMMSTSPECS